MFGTVAENYDTLVRAGEIIAREFRGPACVEASALLIGVANRLGIELRPQAVSVFAMNRRTDATVATGDRGVAFGEGLIKSVYGSKVVLKPLFEGGSPFQMHAGHMIAVSEKHQLVIDPTFAQFEALGDQAKPIFATEVLPKVNGAFWAVGDDDLYVRYFAADDYLGELDFNSVKSRYAERADAIARAVV